MTEMGMKEGFWEEFGKGEMGGIAYSVRKTVRRRD
jgi:hypothetical protein